MFSRLERGRRWAPWWARTPLATHTMSCQLNLRQWFREKAKITIMLSAAGKANAHSVVRHCRDQQKRGSISDSFVWLIFVSIWWLFFFCSLFQIIVDNHNNSGDGNAWIRCWLRYQSSLRMVSISCLPYSTESMKVQQESQILQHPPSQSHNQN